VAGSRLAAWKRPVTLRRFSDGFHHWETRTPKRCYQAAFGPPPSSSSSSCSRLCTIFFASGLSDISRKLPTRLVILNRISPRRNCFNCSTHVPPLRSNRCQISGRQAGDRHRPRQHRGYRAVRTASEKVAVVRYTPPSPTYSAGRYRKASSPAIPPSASGTPARRLRGNVS
jgi:hypothetical protein